MKFKNPFSSGTFNTLSFNPFPNKPWFLHVCCTSLLKTLWEKKKLLVTSNFSFSDSVLCPFEKLFFHFHHIQNCRLQTLSVWKSLKFVVWERVNKVLVRSKLKAFTDDILKFGSNFETCLWKGRKTL